MCQSITLTLQNNNTLLKLSIHGNPITAEGSLIIVDILKDNNSLEVLQVPHTMTK